MLCFFVFWGLGGALGGVVAEKVGGESGQGQRSPPPFCEKVWFYLVKVMFFEGVKGEPRTPRQGHATHWPEDRRLSGLPVGDKGGIIINNYFCVKKEAKLQPRI